MNRARLAGGMLLLAAAAGLAVSPRVALACGLAAWWWALGLVLGVFINAWTHVLTGGAWGAPVRATAAALAPRLPGLLLGLVAVAAAAGVLYPWAAQPASAWSRGIAQPAFLQAWLSPPAFTLRLVLYAAAWWWATRPASLVRKGRAAASLLVHTVATSLAAVDLLASLVPGWASTAFGLVVLGTQALAGAAVVAVLGPRLPTARGAPGVPLSRDIGNLLLTWCMTEGYLAFMQFLVIWAENLPREIAWYLPRLQTGWRWVGLALALALLAAPFVALLFRAVKDHPQRLRAVALLLLAAAALDAAWNVVPSVDPHSPHAWWLAPLAFGGMALLAFAGVDTRATPVSAREARHA